MANGTATLQGAGTAISSDSETFHYTYQAVSGRMKLIRQGSSFSGYVSTEGISWTQLGVSVTMATNVFMGMAVSAGSPTTYSAVSYSDFAVALGPDFYLLSTGETLPENSGNSTTYFTVQAQPLGSFSGSVALTIVRPAHGRDGEFHEQSDIRRWRELGQNDGCRAGVPFLNPHLTSTPWAGEGLSTRRTHTPCPALTLGVIW